MLANTHGLFNTIYMGLQWNKIYKDKLESYDYYDLNQPHEDLHKFAEVLKKNNINSVLELSCGNGRNLRYMTKEGFNVKGMDISPEGIRLAEEHLERENLYAELTVGDMYKELPYEDSSIESLFSLQPNHGTEADMFRLISEMKRVLKPNGFIFIKLPFRTANGEVRYIIVKTARKIAPHTYVPTIGDETGLVHFIYNKKLVNEHYKDFSFISEWRDKRDYFCFIARLM